MAWCGLIGMPLGHSFSPKLHGMLADYDYRLIPLEEKNLPTFLQTEDFLGLNVTIPYKQTVIPLLDELSPEAERIGAVNTILRLPNGRLRGYNTDYDGFVHLLRASGLDVRGKRSWSWAPAGPPARCAVPWKTRGPGRSCPSPGRGRTTTKPCPGTGTPASW